jgi:hypothetical protein
VAVFLIPMHGGIWTLCVSLTGKWTTVSVDMVTLGECGQPYIRVVEKVKGKVTPKQAYVALRGPGA